MGADRRLPTILLIDDDMVSREVMATVLTMSGYTVQTTTGGADAVKLLDSGSYAPEVILMDTQMPGLSGSALIAQLRTRTKAVIYVISGSHAPDQVVKDADGFLLKPLGPEALKRVLEKHTLEIDPAHTTEAPVLNRDTLAQLRKVMPESAVKQIYDAVLSDLEKRQALLLRAIEHGNIAEVRRLGHGIKGGCGMAGAAQAARLGELFETRGDELEYSLSLLKQLRIATGNLKRMLDAEFSPNGPAV